MPSVHRKVPSTPRSLRPMSVERPFVSAYASASSAALWIDARSPPRDWQSARACAKFAGPAWYVKVGEELGGAAPVGQHW